MKISTALVIALITFSNTSFADTANDLQNIKLYTLCLDALSPIRQYMPPDKTGPGLTTTSAEQLEQLLSTVPSAARVEVLTTTLKTVKNAVWSQLNAVTPELMAHAANQEKGLDQARSNFRKAFLSANNPCSRISDPGFSSKFARTEDLVLAGMIQLSQQAQNPIPHRASATTGK